MPTHARLLMPEPTATERDWVTDGIIAAIATLILAVPYAILSILDASTGFDYGGHTTNSVGMVLAAILFTVSLVLRRHYPLAMVAFMAIGGVLMCLAHSMPMFPIIVVPFAAYSVGRWVEGEDARFVLWIGILGSLIGPARWIFGWTWPIGSSQYLVFLFTVCLCAAAVFTPYAIGRRAAEIELGLAKDEERERIEAAAAHQRAMAAEASSRNFIARELHDIVAHSVSVMVVQAEGGRALAAKRPQAALEALESIAEQGREAMVEMRRIVAVLRQGGDAGSEFGPAPGLLEIPELVARSGDRMTLEITGQPMSVSQSVGLTSYRVVQEALTNVIKHAGPDARAHVRLMYSPTMIDIDVRDDGVGGDAGSDGLGHGLRGMHERVASMGGVLTAQPLPGTGFLVHASIPVGQRPY